MKREIEAVIATLVFVSVFLMFSPYVTEAVPILDVFIKVGIGCIFGYLIGIKEFKIFENQENQEEKQAIFLAVVSTAVFVFATLHANYTFDIIDVSAIVNFWKTHKETISTCVVLGGSCIIFAMIRRNSKN